MPFAPRRILLPACACLASVVAGCGFSVGSSTSGPESTSSTSVAPTTSTTSQPPVPTTVETTAPASTSTSAPDPSASTTLPPVYVVELVLSNVGIGSRSFGDAPDDVIEYVSSLLGSPTDDSGWVEAAEFPDCAGTQIRALEWGVLKLQFSDDSPITKGEHFLGWTYGETSEIGLEPTGLATDKGLTPGSTVADVKQVDPEAVFSEGDPDSEFPDSFGLSDGSWGLLSGLGDDDSVTVLASQFGCGG